MTGYACPKGHTSTESDFCSECGAKIQANGAAAGSGGAGAPATGAPAKCPDCGTARFAEDTVFCEICGFNFMTGTHGEIPLPGAAAAVPPPPVPDTPASSAAPQESPAPVSGWTVSVRVDPSLRESGSPPPPADAASFTIELRKELSLIGRTSQSRAIFPEIAIDFDDAVSHRHALLNRDGGGRLLLRDIGSSNGTRLNGKDVEPMTDVELHDGDELTLGHWTRVAVRAIHASA